MPKEIDEQIKYAGEDLIIIRENRRINEKQFVKVNRQVSKEEHLFNSVKCLFSTDSQVQMGDLVFLPTRDETLQYYFIESKNALVSENTKQLNYVTMKRMNCSAFEVVETDEEKDFFNIEKFKYQKKIEYKQQIPAFVFNPLQSESDGFNLSVDTDSINLLVHITANVKRDMILRIIPLSIFDIPEDMSQFYRVRHINITDYPNMMEIKAHNDSISVIRGDSGGGDA